MKRLILTGIILCIALSGKCQYNKGVIIEPLLKTDTTTIGQKIVYPAYADDEVTIMKVTIPPGKSTGWHKHEFPVFAYVIKGSLTVETETGEDLQFKENSSFAEVINVNHNGTNKGIDDVVLIAFYMGEKGRKLSIPKEGLTKK